MKLILLDNNLPPRIAAVLQDFECVGARDVLSADASDKDIFDWCIVNRAAVLVTKDKQFALRIAGDQSALKCILCTFGNISLRQTISLFKERRSAIEYFLKSNAKILTL